jgi:metal-responsive CopG/Arc/MetJ family transcriptional regulator
MTLEDELVKSIDQAAKRLHTTRSAFTRSALREALHNLMVGQMEEKHRRGYRIHPVSKEEVGVWEKEQTWGDK